MKIAIYPGTFDPITYGHIDVLERALEIFDKVIITIAHNTAKEPLFTDPERLDMVKHVIKKYGKHTDTEYFDGLLVNYARKKKAIALVRGLRAVSDFEYELQMALMNRKLANDITTIFFMPHEKHTYLNSSIVREIALLNGDISSFVPAYVQKILKSKVQKLRKRKK
ncbi:MAG: pantetheine-phosphate adenylyltransferase [Bacteroidetes bacterium]|nr:pantetheine-phosphate adenylyltransferase [Bacteroidota bacterium]MBU1422700.1 pantetheine-phosphate adenylyltransferase [Bacteroidota bacterium]MBU2471526.1 pantetheine-phosphate adenylyltransferase [Bacteroidota bacterium]MBU2636826.1 pantetheine-phosphate adenylyltransferase [Bacteroidota bacterium]